MGNDQEQVPSSRSLSNMADGNKDQHTEVTCAQKRTMPHSPSGDSATTPSKKPLMSNYVSNGDVTPTKTPPNKKKFSPLKLASPFKALSGCGIMDGGADYSKPCTSSQSVSNTDEAEVMEDPDLFTLSQELDLDPDLMDSSNASDGPTDQCLFHQLPLEVMENIFCRLPILDLCLHVSLVCSHWQQIISNEKFLYWKKTYFRVLRGSEAHKKVVMDIMTKRGVALDLINEPTGTSPLVLPSVIRSMKDFKPVTTLDMNRCLKKHPKYSWAVALLQERIPDCIVDDTPQPWCVIAALTVLSEDVDDILRVLSCLMSPAARCTGQEVIECLYCVATSFLVLRSIKYQEAWTTMHYRVFYALYLFENSSVVVPNVADNSDRGPEMPVAPPVSDAGVKFTQEQLRICKHNVARGDVLKIVAFAGTGKTSTLIHYAELRPHTKFLLLVFNRSVKEDCQARVPPNVQVFTSHGLAHAAVGIKYKRQFRSRRKDGSYKEHCKLGHSISVKDIVDQLRKRPGESLYVQAKLVLETLKAFMSSAETEITHLHVPFYAIQKNGSKEYVGEGRRANAVSDAKRVWKKLIDPDDPMQISHDTYLKLYQLSRPQIRHPDMILVDEAQDQTPAVIDILLHQSQAKILVGDPNQQIYTFRGAVNAMERIPATTTFYLTQSFRFGSNIAHVANSCLEVLKGLSHKLLVGNTSKGVIDGRRVGQVAIIARTNFALFKEAVRKCSYSDEPIKVAFAGGDKSFGFDRIRDIYHLYAGDVSSIKDPMIKKFQSLDDLEGFATMMQDVELSGKIKIVRHYRFNVESHIDRILKKCVQDLSLADLVFSTAHKAKGLEFSTVRLTDDFAMEFIPHSSIRVKYHGLEVPGETNQQVPVDELNLLYVAVTRAKKALQLTPTLMRVLHFAGERFRVARQSSQLPVLVPCVLSRQDFKPSAALTLHRKAMSLGDGQVVSPGYYMPHCVSKALSSLAGLYGEREGEERSPDDEPISIDHEGNWLPRFVLHAAGMVALLDLPNVDDLGSDDDDDDADFRDIL